MQEALSILRQVFGYQSFRGDQAEIIGELLAGNDALVLMPTGGGKSLCYQIPGILRPGLAIVVSPLIALMQDQVQALLQLGVKAAFLNSSLTTDEARAVEQTVRAGELDLLYVAPERLLMPRFLQMLSGLDLALFAIDEAHCVSQWGHDFRPEYVQLSILKTQFPKVPRIALTATADEPTRKEIIERLGLSQAKHFSASFDRPNIRYRIIEKNHPRDQLHAFLEAEHRADAGIVYCLSRRKVEEIAEFLRSKGWDALPYHAGLSAPLRQKHQERFLREENVIIVATIAFGMGIDKPNVRFVVHMDLPKSMEAYYQETGRAGRDGLPANAWMVYGLSDVIMLRQMLDQSQADEQHKRLERRKLDALLGYAETTLCRRKVMLNYFAESYEGRCENCDNCLEPLATWDGLIAAQKALSCVYRTGQHFGVKHLVDVLLGKKTPQVEKFAHEQVSTFGIGQEFTVNQWSSIYRQLVAADLLSVDIEGYGGLKLTEKSQSVLRGQTGMAFRTERESAKTGSRSKSKGSKDLEKPTPVSGDLLWQALKAKRLELAKEQGVPPYVIFHDRTLIEIHEKEPLNLDDFATISGVGESKLRRYGQIFIDLIRYLSREFA